MRRDGVEDLAERLATDLTATLGSDLLTLAAHGSWVAGDFSPDRSDLDLLAVLTRDPDAVDHPPLARLHADVERDHPAWVDRVEVGYVGVEALHDVLAGVASEHVMLRVSPGEQLHAIAVTRHHILDWEAARRADRAVIGMRPTDVIPPIPQGAVDDVLSSHLRSWPSWLEESTYTGFRAYAVLTVARCRVRLATGHQLSKRAAAAAAAEAFPEWAGVLAWAEWWWYDGGRDDDEAPLDVRPFVLAMAGNEVPTSG